MNGVTWDERQPTDWLASNGRWYPRSHYPRHWDMLALPPAPGHGLVAGLRRSADDASSTTHATQRPPQQPPSTRTSTRPPPRTNPSSAPPPPRRPAPPTTPLQKAPPSAPAPPITAQRPQPRTAEAEATNVRTYKYRIEPGAAPPKGLPSARDLPPPPGRLAPLPGNDGQPASQQAPSPAPASAPPARVESPPTPPTPGRPKKASGSSSALSGISVFGKDFEQVLGSARKRIEEAIEDSADRENWK